MGQCCLKTWASSVFPTVVRLGDEAKTYKLSAWKGKDWGGDFTGKTSDKSLAVISAMNRVISHSNGQTFQNLGKTPA